jgi:hypothetical protein
VAAAATVQIPASKDNTLYQTIRAELPVLDDR